MVHIRIDFALQTGSISVPFEGLGWPFQTNWVQNQIDYKPDGPFTFSLNYYDYVPTAPLDQRSVLFIGATGLRTVTDPHETLAFVTRPRSKATGAEIALP